jgi:uncharacterized protein (TIGR03435 family)
MGEDSELRLPPRRAEVRLFSSRSRMRTWLAPCLLILSASPIAQAPPAFEVASVKRNVSGRMPLGPIRYQTGRFVAENTALRWLISSAYGGPRDLPPDYIEGGPPWIDTDGFDIDARTGGNPPPTATRAMLRSLLEDRFGLNVHREPRERQVQALVLAGTNGRIGPQLRRSDGSDCTRDPATVSATLPRCEGGKSRGLHAGTCSCHADAADLRERHPHRAGALGLRLLDG